MKKFLFAVSVAIGLSSPTFAQGADGGLLFKQRCQACHTPTPGPMAPSLKGVVGRKAGSTNFNYSTALKTSNLVWTKDNLDKFLLGPAKFVPGTKMVIAVTDPAVRSALIAFLAKQK